MNLLHASNIQHELDDRSNAVFRFVSRCSASEQRHIRQDENLSSSRPHTDTNWQRSRQTDAHMRARTHADQRHYGHKTTSRWMDRASE